MNRSAALACLVLLPSCSLLKAKADPTRYFVLTAAETTKTTSPVSSTIGIDHVTLPEYLVRDEMVSRTATNQIDIADYNRWGEPLREGFLRALRGDLEAQLGENHVVVQPFEAARTPHVLLDIEVRHFERIVGVGVELDATWVLRDKGGAVLSTRDVKKTEPVADTDVGHSVAALSRCLIGLSVEIADAVRGLKR